MAFQKVPQQTAAEGLQAIHELKIIWVEPVKIALRLLLRGDILEGTGSADEAVSMAVSQKSSFLRSRKQRGFRMTRMTVIFFLRKSQRGLVLKLKPGKEETSLTSSRKEGGGLFQAQRPRLGYRRSHWI